MDLDVAGEKAARLAKLVTDVMWWVGLAAFVVFALLFLTAPLLQRAGVQTRFEWNSLAVTRGNGGLPVVGLQVSVPADQASRPLTSPDPLRASDPALMHESRARVEFRTSRWGFVYLVNALFLPFFAAMLFGVHLLRSFLADVLATDVFTSRNAKRLSNLGWLVIALCVAAPQLEQLRAWWILRSTPLSGASLSPASSDYGGLWLVGALTLVLAAAWRYGAELQQERNLTV